VGQEVAVFRQTSATLKFPTEEIMSAKNFNFAPKYFKIGVFSQNFAFLTKILRQEK